MAKRFKLRELEKEKGDLNNIIPALVNKHGQGEAARLLGLSQFTVSNWLKTNGYTMKIVYVRQEQAS